MEIGEHRVADVRGIRDAHGGNEPCLECAFHVAKEAWRRVLARDEYAASDRTRVHQAQCAGDLSAAWNRIPTEDIWLAWPVHEVRAIHQVVPPITEQ